jgi:homoserine kinase
MPSEDLWDDWHAVVGSRKGEVTSVTVRVPATSANLGPGFDVLGLAVDMWNELTVERSPTWSLMITGEGADSIPRTRENLVVVGLEMVFQRFGVELPTLSYFCKNGIPFGSGLGSSSAAIVSGLLAGLVLAGKELPVSGQEMLLQMAAEVEGHVDNLAPCIYGALSFCRPLCWCWCCWCGCWCCCRMLLLLM